MSDEAAFLDALKANPADDTTRLVYADWLDEHNEPAKAEYLRLTRELARTSPIVNPAATTFARLRDLSASIPLEWVAAAGSGFGLNIVGYAQGRQVASIRALQECTGLSMASAKKVTESLPACLVVSGPIHTLTQYEQKLSSAESEVRYVATGSIEAAAFRFDAYVSGYALGESRWAKLPGIIETLLGIEIGELPSWNNSEGILLARGVDACTAGRLQTQLREVPDPDGPSDENQSHTHVFNLRIVPVAPG